MRLRRRDQLPDLFRGQAARVGDLREIVAIALQVADVVVRRYPDDDQLAVFIRTADRLDLYTRRRRGERTAVLEDVGVIRQLRGRADVVPEHIFRRRNARHFRQVIDERAHVVRLRRPLLHRLREVLVLRLRRVARVEDHLLRGHRDRREYDRGSGGDHRDAAGRDEGQGHAALLMEEAEILTGCTSAPRSMPNAQCQMFSFNSR